MQAMQLAVLAQIDGWLCSLLRNLHKCCRQFFLQFTQYKSVAKFQENVPKIKDCNQISIKSTKFKVILNCQQGY